MNPDDIKCDMKEHYLKKSGTIGVEIKESRLEQAEQIIVYGEHIKYSVLIELAILLACELKNRMDEAEYQALTLSLLREIK